MSELLVLLMLQCKELRTSQVKTAYTNMQACGILDADFNLTMKGKGVLAELQLEYKKLRRSKEWSMK